METQATHAFVIEAETGTVLLDKAAMNACRRPR